MTLTIKDSPDLNSPGKPGAPSQNSESKPGQSPRSNPVCLEVAITIRSLPNEAGGLTQPIREEGRTVIVFDNGAVLRSTNNMPIGQTVILSNPKGRDVVCRVVGGRNMPSVKGYVEIEFIEPVNDFWGIHQDSDPATVAPPPVALHAPLDAPVTQHPATPRASVPLEMPSKPASVSLGSGPTFEDIPGLLSVPASAATRETKTESARPGFEKLNKDVSDYNLTELATSTSVANWRPSASEPAAEKRSNAATSDASSNSSPAPSHDFLSKGLMAYEPPDTTSNASNGRTPLIVGLAALVLAGIGTVVFFMHRKTAPIPVANTPVASQPSTPEPQTAKYAPEPVQAPKEESAQATTQTETQTLPQTPAQTVAVEQAQPVAAVAPVPALVTSPATSDSRTQSRPEQRIGQRQEKKSVAPKQPDLSSSRSPVIPNLKMASPSAPKQSTINPSEGTTPLTDIASTEAVGGSTPAGLLTSAGRTSNPPAAPPSAPALAPVSAAKTVSDPKLISSTRLVYPPTARQTKVQGVVTVSASIDQNGKVVSANALSGPLLLRQAAVDSVKQWKYSPGLLDGKPTPTQLTVNVDFRLN
jgi:TonB family protein